MNKKVVTTILLASFLTLNMSFTVLAAPASTNTVVTGRTEQNRITGIITPRAIETPIYHNVTNSITFTGTVVIDGPQLVFTVTDPRGNAVSSENIKIVKVLDKTYEYSVTVNPSEFKGNVKYTFNAKTIYINGKTAGQTHTSAQEVKQSIRVAYVSGFEYSKFAFGAYDRTNNRYPYSYEFSKFWDDGSKETTNVSGFLDATKSLTIEGSDATYDGGIYKAGVETPAVNIHSFSIEEDSWSYNNSTGKYDLSFTLIKDLSNGNTEKETVSVPGVSPLASYKYTARDARSMDYSKDFTFTAPAAPVTEVKVPVVSNVKVEVNSSIWTGKDANGGNVKEAYTLTFEIDGYLYSEQMETNFTKNGTGFVTQNLTYSVVYEGQTVVVPYSLAYSEPSSKDVNTTNSVK